MARNSSGNEMHRLSFRISLEARRYIFFSFSERERERLMQWCRHVKHWVWRQRRPPEPQGKREDEVNQKGRKEKKKIANENLSRDLTWSPREKNQRYRNRRFQEMKRELSKKQEWCLLSLCSNERCIRFDREAGFLDTPEKGEGMKTKLMERNESAALVTSKK
jgi:hypothetical protein